MGRLEYNSSRPPIEVEDDILAHLKVVIATKLRRQESFMMTWPAGAERRSRLTVWMHPSIPLIIEIDTEKSPTLDPRRIEKMMGNLNSRGELILDDL